MIDLYTARTPNGYKISIMLEETGLPYNAVKVDLAKGEQRAPDYLKINPNGKIPAIVERETGQRVFESGAILIYLAEKSGRFLPAEAGARLEVLQWLFFQVGHIGPMLGQLWHFVDLNHEIPYALERYRKETLRLFEVVDRRLRETRYLAGGDYSIADIAAWPWLRVHKALGVDAEPFANVRRWIEEIAGRPAVQKGITVPA
jgi:glutathione S-transferase